MSWVGVISPTVLDWFFSFMSSWHHTNFIGNIGLKEFVSQDT